MAEKVTLTTMSHDAIVDVKISGIMYENIQGMLTFFLTRVDERIEVARILNELAHRQPQSQYEFHIMTLLHLIRAIEEAAVEQKLTKEQEVTLPEDAPEN